MGTGIAQVDPKTLSGRRKNAPKHLRLEGFLVVVIALFFVANAAPVSSRQAAAPQASQSTLTQTVKCLIGIENIKPNTRGVLSSQPAGLEFTAGRNKLDISTSSIQDIFTGQESRQDVSGMQGEVVKAAIPYEGGRFVSLFSHKVEVLTLEYSDSNGGLHGAVFVLGAGQATEFKNQLVAQGARVTKHIERPEPQEVKP